MKPDDFARLVSFLSRNLSLGCDKAREKARLYGFLSSILYKLLTPILSEKE